MADDSTTFANPVHTSLEQLRASADGGEPSHRLRLALRTAEILTHWCGLLALPWDDPSTLTADQRRTVRSAFEPGSFGSWARVWQDLGGTATTPPAGDQAPHVDFLSIAAAWSVRVYRKLKVPPLPDAHVITLRNQFQHGWGHSEPSAPLLDELTARIEDQVAAFPVLIEALVLDLGPEQPQQRVLEYGPVRTATSDVRLFPGALVTPDTSNEGELALVVMSRMRVSARVADYGFTHSIGIKRMKGPPADALRSVARTLRRRSPLPSLEAAQLIGRDEALKAALGAVDAARPGDLLMLEAEPGLGKSALLAQLGRELHGRPDGGDQVAVHGTYFERTKAGRGDPTTVLAALVDELFDDPEQREEADLELIVDELGQYCTDRHAAGKRTILLIDALDEINRLARRDDTRDQPDQMLLGVLRSLASCGAVIVASRRTGTGPPLTGPRERALLPLPLPRLSHQASVKLLDAKLGDRSIHHESTTLTEVARRSEGLPLFLELAATDLRNTSWEAAQHRVARSVEEYLEALRQDASAATTTDVVDQVLAVLAFAGTPVPEAVLVQAVRDDPTITVRDPARATARALSWLAPMLSDAPPCGTRLFHTIVVDYLRKPDRSEAEPLATRADRWAKSLRGWTGGALIDPACIAFALTHGERLTFERWQRSDPASRPASLALLMDWITDETLAEQQRRWGPVAATAGLRAIADTITHADLPLVDVTRLAMMRVRRHSLAAEKADPLGLLRLSVRNSAPVDDLDELLELTASEQRGLLHLALLIELALHQDEVEDLDQDLVSRRSTTPARWQDHERILLAALFMLAPELPADPELVRQLVENGQPDLAVTLLRAREDLLRRTLKEGSAVVLRALLERTPRDTSDRQSIARVLVARRASGRGKAKAGGKAQEQRTDLAGLRPAQLVERAMSGEPDATALVTQRLLENDRRSETVDACLALGHLAPIDAALADDSARAQVRAAVHRSSMRIADWRVLRNHRNVVLAIEFTALGPRSSMPGSRGTKGGKETKIAPAALLRLAQAARASQDPKLAQRIVAAAQPGGTLRTSQKKDHASGLACAWALLGQAGHAVGNDELVAESRRRLEQLLASQSFPRNQREIVEEIAVLLASIGCTDEARSAFLRAIDLALDSRLDEEVSRFSRSVLERAALVMPHVLPDLTSRLLRSRRESAVAYERARLFVEAGQRQQTEPPITIPPARIRRKWLDVDAIASEAKARVLAVQPGAPLRKVSLQTPYDVPLDWRIVCIAGSYSTDEYVACSDGLAPNGEHQRAALAVLRAG